MATQHSYGKIVSSGLVLYLNAADRNSYPGSGTAWNDISGNSNTGTLTNGPTFNSGNGGSIVFDGTNDFVNLGDPSLLRLGTSNFTINLWINTSNSLLDCALLSKRQQLTPFNLINLGIGSWSGADGGFAGVAAKNIRIALRQDGSNQYVAYTTNDIIDGLWKNISIVRSSGTFAIYSNGISQSLTILYNTGTGISSDISVTSANWSIGAIGDIGISFFIGNIAQTLIYNRALSTTEILQNYNATKTRFGLT